MNIENSAFIVCSLCGFIFSVAGTIVWYFPPKEINALCGYRTTNSMKSKERWDFAQKYSAKEMIKWGVLFLLIAVIVLIIDPEDSIGVIATLILLALTCISLFLKTEKAIKNRFKNINNQTKN